MKTYLDILKEIIKNQDLLKLILYYAHTYPASSSRSVKLSNPYPYSKNYIVWNSLDYIFNETKAAEGPFFWYIFKEYHLNVADEDTTIYEWRPATLWAEELNIDHLWESKHKHRYYSTSAGLTAYLLLASNHSILDPQTTKMLKFIARYNRPPNDFDDFQ